MYRLFGKLYTVGSFWWDSIRQLAKGYPTSLEVFMTLACHFALPAIILIIRNICHLYISFFFVFFKRRYQEFVYFFLSIYQTCFWKRFVLTLKVVHYNFNPPFRWSCFNNKSAAFEHRIVCWGPSILRVIDSWPEARLRSSLRTQGSGGRCGEPHTVGFESSDIFSN